MKPYGMLTVALGATVCLSAQPPDFTPPTPLFGAVLRNDAAALKQVLAGGANPNEGQFLGFKPVFFPIIYQNLDALRAMAEAGADVRVAGPDGATTLMWAAFNETGKTELVEELLKLGVDPNTRSQNGETALTWAMRRGYAPVIDALKKGGASDAPMIRESVERAISLLQKSGPQFVKVSGCTSCHHQSLPQMTVGLARERGFAIDEQSSQYQVKAVMAMFRPMRDLMMQGTDKFPNPPISVSYSLIGLAAEGYAPDDVTDAMAHLIASKQLPDGSFRVLGARPPLEASNLTATALSIRALQLYHKNPEQPVARAKDWLQSATPQTHEDRTMQLLGLHWAKADAALIAKAARALLAQQRTDGGWGQLPTLETDAYATGQALVTLNQSGQLTTSDPAYQRGVAYLLRTQLSDGSWLVRSRTYPFQPYKESGFPHGKNQWISAAGSSWATMALTLTQPVSKTQLSKMF
jgi:hypothetical protein